MDAVQVLKQAHDEAKSLFQQIEQASPDQRAGLWARLRPELEAHEQYEERLVYGPVAKDAQGTEPVLTSWDEQHHAQVEEAKALIDKIGRLEPSDPQWLATVRQLQATMERHIQQEETDIFPRIQQVWSPDRREDVGKQVQAAKSAASAGAAASGAVGRVAESIKDAAKRLTGQ